MIPTDDPSPETLARSIYPSARVREGLRRSRTPVPPFALADRAFARMKALDTLRRPRNANFVLNAFGRAAARSLAGEPPLAADGDLPAPLRRAIAASGSVVAPILLDALGRLRAEDPPAFRAAALELVGRRSLTGIAREMGRPREAVSVEHRRARDRLVAALRDAPRPRGVRPGPHDLQRPFPLPWSARFLLEYLRIARFGHNRWFPP